jgi:hypothetical protein
MSIRYERDDASRRLLVTMQGVFEMDEVLEAIARQRVEDTWTYGILYDLRGLIGHPTIAELRQIMSQAAPRGEREGPRGPVVLLATEPTLYVRLCTYAALGRSATKRIEVFRDWDEAERWLTAALAG